MATDRFITRSIEIDPKWLTEILTVDGALQSGAVARVDRLESTSTNAHISRIRVTYSPTSVGRLPTQLLLKVCFGEEFAYGTSEVDYYLRDYRGLDDAPLLHCYYAASSPADRTYSILLDDVTETHQNSWDVDRTLSHGLAIARALAVLHAHRWGEGRWGDIGADRPSSASLERYFSNVLPGLSPLLESCRSELAPRSERTLRYLAEWLPSALAARLENACGLTVVHGDPNPGNILSPRAAVGPTYLIDRQPFSWSLTTWYGAHDLAYLMVLYWDAEVRQTLEVPMLKEYHRILNERGISGYSWDALWSDYRLSVIQCVTVPFAWCVDERERTTMKWVWFRQLGRCLTAFDDLRCDQVWSPAV